MNDTALLILLTAAVLDKLELEPEFKAELEKRLEVVKDDFALQAKFRKSLLPFLKV